MTKKAKAIADAEVEGLLSVQGSLLDDLKKIHKSLDTEEGDNTFDAPILRARASALEMALAYVAAEIQRRDV